MKVSRIHLLYRLEVHCICWSKPFIFKSIYAILITESKSNCLVSDEYFFATTSHVEPRKTSDLNVNLKIFNHDT